MERNLGRVSRSTSAGRYGAPADGESLKSEDEDETKRRYSRMAAICEGGLWPGFLATMDEVASKRSKIGSKV
jgi:hypothetical protein